ncbi:MAG: methylmalonyl-CoA mutase family protein [Methanomassiliicoccales archaeon]
MKQKKEFIPEVPTSVPVREKLVFEPSDVKADFSSDIGFPGEPPYTRGTSADGYRSKDWVVMHYLHAPEPASNRPLLTMLIQEGIGVAGIQPDTSCRAGKDTGGFGDGILLTSKRDFLAIAGRSNLGSIALRLDGGAMLPALSALCLSSGNLTQLHPLIDPFSDDLLTRCLLSPTARLDLSGKALDHMLKQGVLGKIVFSAWRIGEVSFSPALQLAYAAFNAQLYLRMLEKRGYEIKRLLPIVEFELPVSENFPQEVAKFRAARRFLYRTFKSINEDGAPPHLFARGTINEFTEEQQQNNAVRSTIQCMAAAVGGAEGIAIGEPTARSGEGGWKDVRYAIRAQQIVAHEANVGHTTDPAGGSYYIEAKTEDYAKQAESIFHSMLEDEPFEAFVNYIAAPLLELRERQKTELEEGTSIRVGVNLFREKGRRSRRGSGPKYIKPQSARNYRPVDLEPKSMDEMVAFFKRGGTLWDVFDSNR